MFEVDPLHFRSYVQFDLVHSVNLHRPVSSSKLFSTIHPVKFLPIAQAAPTLLLTLLHNFSDTEFVGSTLYYLSNFLPYDPQAFLFLQTVHCHRHFLPVHTAYTFEPLLQKLYCIHKPFSVVLLSYLHAFSPIFFWHNIPHFDEDPSQ